MNYATTYAKIKDRSNEDSRCPASNHSESYAQSHLLPNIPDRKNISHKGVMTATSTSCRSVAERYGFEFCTTNEKDIFENKEINTNFIATRHDSYMVSK